MATVGAAGRRPISARNVSRDGSGLASFYQRGETYLAHPTQVEIVPVTTMDQAIENFGLGHVDFMKVDVEGAESLVFAGAKTMVVPLSLLT